MSQATSYEPSGAGNNTDEFVAVLSEEVALGMALLGVTSIDQLRPEMVNTTDLLNSMWRPERSSILSRL